MAINLSDRFNQEKRASIMKQTILLSVILIWFLVRLTLSKRYKEYYVKHPNETKPEETNKTENNTECYKCHDFYSCGCEAYDAHKHPIDLDLSDVLGSLERHLKQCDNYTRIYHTFYALTKRLNNLRRRVLFKKVLFRGGCERFVGKRKRCFQDDLTEVDFLMYKFCFDFYIDFDTFDEIFIILPGEDDDDDEEPTELEPLSATFCLGYATDCAELRARGKNYTTGIYKIWPEYSNNPFDVFCDMDTDGGGWTVFQKRHQGSVDFYRGKSSYEYGFGQLTEDFWLGLKKLRHLVLQAKSQIRIDMEDAEGITRYAQYDNFEITSETDGYRLILGMYSGNAGDSLSYHSNQRFSTPDSDNDMHPTKNCAESHAGGWWYRDCLHSNLNGLYLLGPNSFHQKGINWYHFRGFDYSLKKTEMKIRQMRYATTR